MTCHVRFEDDGLTIAVAEGAKLTDVCDHHKVSLLFGCREANCGTCLIEVTSGGEHLSPVVPNERELLDIFAAYNPRARLACQCRVHGDCSLRVLR